MQMCKCLYNNRCKLNIVSCYRIFRRKTSNENKNCFFFPLGLRNKINLFSVEHSE